MSDPETARSQGVADHGLELHLIRRERRPRAVAISRNAFSIVESDGTTSIFKFIVDHAHPGLAAITYQSGSAPYSILMDGQKDAVRDVFDGAVAGYRKEDIRQARCLMALIAALAGIFLFVCGIWLATTSRPLIGFKYEPGVYESPVKRWPMRSSVNSHENEKLRISAMMAY